MGRRCRRIALLRQRFRGRHDWPQYARAPPARGTGVSGRASADLSRFVSWLFIPTHIRRAVAGRVGGVGAVQDDQLWGEGATRAGDLRASKRPWSNDGEGPDVRLPLCLMTDFADIALHL